MHATVLQLVKKKPSVGHEDNSERRRILGIRLHLPFSRACSSSDLHLQIRIQRCLSSTA